MCVYKKIKVYANLNNVELEFLLRKKDTSKANP